MVKGLCARIRADRRSIVKSKVVLKPDVSNCYLLQSTDQLFKKNKAIRFLKLRLQSFGTKCSKGQVSQKVALIEGISCGNKQKTLFDDIPVGRSANSKADIELDSLGPGPVGNDDGSLDKRLILELVHSSSSASNTSDSGSSLPRKRRFKVLSNLPRFKRVFRWKSQLQASLPTPIIGNQPLTEAEESSRHVSVLLDEDVLDVRPIEPLIIETCFAYKQQAGKTMPEDSSGELGCKIVQSGAPRPTHLDEETAVSESGSLHSAADPSFGSKNNVGYTPRIKRKIVKISHETQNTERKQLDIDDLAELGVDLDIFKKKPDLCLDGQDEDVAQPDGIGPTPKRAGSGKTVSESLPFSWTLMGKRMTPVFQDVHVNKWPAHNRTKSRSKSPLTSVCCSQSSKDKKEVLTGAHPWQSLLKDFGPSFDESSDEDVIQRGIECLKQHLHAGLKEMDRKHHPSDSKNMKLVTEILLMPEENSTKIGKKKPTFGTSAKTESHNLHRTSSCVLTPLEKVLKDTLPIEMVNRESTRGLLHKSGAELARQPEPPSCSQRDRSNSAEEFLDDYCSPKRPSPHSERLGSPRDDQLAQDVEAGEEFL